MTAATLDRDRVRELFDLRSSYNVWSGGAYEDDPYPSGTAYAKRGRCCPAPPRADRSTGTMFFHGLPYPDRPHFTVFDYDSCIAAYRNPVHSPRPRSPSTSRAVPWA